MKLSYRAVTKDGKTVRGIVDAKDVKEAASYLRSRDLLPVQISAKNTKKSGIFPFLNKANNSNLVFFTRQLSSMLSSGLTLIQSLRILKDQIQSDAMEEIIGGIIADIEEGKSFSTAIEKYPAFFSSVYVSLIKASETSGLLDKILSRLADNLEKQQKLKSTIRGALLYPTIVVLGMVAVMTIMMIFVIPQLSVLYENLNIPLPLPTLIVMGISNFVITFWPFIIGVSFLGVFTFRRWHKTTEGKLVIDDLVLKIPIFGKLISQSILTEFTRTFGLLVGSGALVIEALNRSSDVAGNIIYKNAILGLSSRVEKGMTVKDAMTQYTLFPQILIEMVSVGEQTGKLDESLLRVSEYFEREVEQTVKTLTTAMEPFIMVCLGAAVAFLIISVITPIYNLTSSIQ